MADTIRAPLRVQVGQSQLKTEPSLTAAERRHVALAALAIQERRFQLRIAQIQHEWRALLQGSL